MNDSAINQGKRYDNFWLLAGLLGILLATSMSRDIFRPFYGLHSWGEAHSYWNARVHLNYGLGYTVPDNSWLGHTFRLLYDNG